jgi:hypothetical protein
MANMQPTMHTQRTFTGITVVVPSTCIVLPATDIAALAVSC